MRIVLPVCAALVLLAGCGRPAAVPKAAFEEFKARVVAQDFNGVYDMLCARTKQQLNAATSPTVGRSEPGREVFIDLCRQRVKQDPEGWEKVARTRFFRCYIDGDHAKVYTKVDGREQPDDPVALILEDGQWKLDWVLFVPGR